MDQPPGSPRQIRFGVFEFDVHTRELRKNGMKVKLHGQPAEVLALLLERPGELLTREDLQKRLWHGDAIVEFDYGINAAVKRAREALGDDADAPRYIETLPRRGYRFIYPVATATSPPDNVGTGEVPAQGRPRRAPKTLGPFALAAGITIAVLVTLLILNVAGLRDRLWSRPSPPRIHSIAVLPLENLSGDPEQEYFTEGMTDELITRLAQIHALRVISRASVMQYKARRKTTPEIARELNVDAVVEGTVLRSGNRVRISAQLIQANPERHLWAESYERDLRGVLGLQRDVALAIANRIRIAVKPGDQARLANARPVNPEAHELDLKGRFFWNKLNVEGFKQGAEYFQQAAEKDPDDGMAYAGLADSYLFLWIWGVLPTQEGCSRARGAAEKALAIDESLAEAHASLARVRFECDWNWPAAEKEFKRAIDLNPSYVNRAAGYPYYLSAMGRQEEALAEIQKDHSLDPVGLITNFKLAGILFFSRHFDRAIEQFRKTLELYPDTEFARMELAQVYERTGMYKQAIDEYQKAIALHGASEVTLSVLHRAYMKSGVRGYWQSELKSLKADGGPNPAGAYQAARICAHLGQKDEAHEWLEKAYRSRNPDLVYLQVDPTLDPLRSDPRFQELVRRMNFPP